MMALKAYVMMTDEDRSDYNGDIKKEAYEEGKTSWEGNCLMS